MWIKLLLFSLSLLIFKTTHGGILTATFCSDTRCTLSKCKQIDLNVVYDGVCRWYGEYAATYECINNKYLIIKRFKNKSCNGLSYETINGGQCYLGPVDGGSYFYSCQEEGAPIKGNPQTAQKGKNDKIFESYMYIGGALAVLAVFLCGILGGYLVQRKRCACCCPEPSVDIAKLMMEG